MAKTGRIADIQRTSLHDGAGIRTTVFFKGCPLSCAWCHNPECISFEPQVLFYPEKCIGCGLCHQGCYSGAKVLCGKDMTVSELMKEILLDKDYFSSGGGVTFSGGEPLAQKEFLSAAIDACREEGVGCAVETSLLYFDESVFKKLDFVMADLKIWNTDIHRQYTGVGNEQIKENFIKLNALNIPIIARTPVIPGIEQGIEEISAFLKTLKNVKQYELLPYHPLGNAKCEALGLSPQTFEIPSTETMKRLEEYAYIR